MAIFGTLRGKRGARRESMFGGSVDDQPTSKSKASTTPYNRDATDVLGESPSFARKRTPSDNTSLKNRNSASNMLRLFGSNKRAASASGHDPNGPAPGSSSISDAGHRTSQTVTRPETAAAANRPSSPASTQNGGISETLGSPRPSELFAGKGVNWEQLKLSGATVAPSDPKRNDELQTYLKARRQWIPTFKTEDENAENDSDRPAARLEEVSFGGAPAAPEGLMTLNDLEASHNRKQHLLSDIPISSLSTDSNPDASSSSAIGAGGDTSSKPPLISRTSQSSTSIRATSEAPVRNQSFRQSPFVGNNSGSSTAINGGSTTMNRTTSTASAGGPVSPARKPAPSAAAVIAPRSNGNGSANGAVPTAAPAPAAAAAAAAVKPTASSATPDQAPPNPSAPPPRKSSVAALPAGQVGTSSSSSNDTVLVPAASTFSNTKDTETASSTLGTGVRPSMDSTTGFQTPEARSEVAHADPEQTPKVA
ncbi:unnamed protein product [Tilletia controversa]|uniref:Uncharacterized protein n=3 Tax=Tilletia TaxID=13289 RepID=A0A8X7MZZ8_9BASI|nr:hypothetical protein CF336_g938 [Tilletia laevis]KAE8204398.1 hypothetical protein CF328_g1114 [Tilletia controversa]KAE8264545.1 hypothetical protein A4X03_0g879 [Tilletia caries]KAE8207679.1 hypothetical protein CF335_g966 [Tilletia laevis]KAE8253802.1 hypothetical protein A4X06_0g1219 [Tilletia controversa]